MDSNYVNHAQTRALIKEYYQHPLIRGGFIRLPAELQVTSEWYRIHNQNTIQVPKLKVNKILMTEDLIPGRISDWEILPIVLYSNNQTLEASLSKLTKNLDETLVPLDLRQTIDIQLLSYFDSALWKGQLVGREIFEETIKTKKFLISFVAELTRTPFPVQDSVSLVTFTFLRQTFYNTLNKFTLPVDPQTLSLWDEF